MTKQEKQAFVQQLASQLKEKPNFYVVDLGGLTVEQNNQFRRKLFQNKLSVQMAKNTLIKKAMEQAGLDHSSLGSALTQSSSIIFVNEKMNEPAKVMKEYLAGKEKPVLKGALLENSAYTGPKVLDTLANLKGKEELIGEIITLLQSPMQNVLGGLLSGKDQIGGIVKALADRKQA